MSRPVRSVVVDIQKLRGDVELENKAITRLSGFGSEPKPDGRDGRVRWHD